MRAWRRELRVLVRSDILVAQNTPQHLERTWEVNEADIRWSDALYPLARHAMQRGYYMPNRNSRHCSRHQFLTGAAASRILVAW